MIVSFLLIFLLLLLLILLLLHIPHHPRHLLGPLSLWFCRWSISTRYPSLPSQVISARGSSQFQYWWSIFEIFEDVRWRCCFLLASFIIASRLSWCLIFSFFVLSHRTSNWCSSKRRITQAWYGRRRQCSLSHPEWFLLSTSWLWVILRRSWFWFDSVSCLFVSDFYFLSRIPCHFHLRLPPLLAWATSSKHSSPSAAISQPIASPSMKVIKVCLFCCSSSPLMCCSSILSLSSSFFNCHLFRPVPSIKPRHFGVSVGPFN